MYMYMYSYLLYMSMYMHAFYFNMCVYMHITEIWTYAIKSTYPTGLGSQRMVIVESVFTI